MTKPVQRKNNVQDAVKDAVTDVTDDDKQAVADGDAQVDVHVHHHHHHHRRKKFKRKFVNFFTRSRRITFILGALVGLLTAWYYTAPAELNIDIESLLGELPSFDFDGLSLDTISFDSISDFMGDIKGKLPTRILQEASSIEKSHKNNQKAAAFAVGYAMKDEGLKSKYNVVLVPGVISTGLESWSLQGTAECPTESHFRKRMWGSWYMIRVMLLDKYCWLQNLMLDPDTGLDPPHFKLRAAQGFASADFFMAGYWLWNKLLENLAVLGYDTDTMQAAAYDWRLSYPNLEKRDGYFSKLKLSIEETKRLTGQKTVITGHSMGSQVIFYFMKWVEAEGYGNGGSSWVNDHIDSFVDISGSMLGTPKTLVALLSGEMKDTVQLNAMAVYGLEQFFSRRERADLLRTFGGIASMIPKGGKAVWGDHAGAPDDAANQTVSFGNFIKFKQPLTEYSAKNLTMDETIDFLYSQSPGWFVNRTEDSYSFGIAKTRAEVEANERRPSAWSNPLEAALPNAPDLKIYCFYGIGKDTERAYYYQDEPNPNATNLNVSIAGQEPDGVIMGQGDGTVSLTTHTMCHRWKDLNSKFNPGGAKVKVVEMLHQPDRLDIRGGAQTAEHVDILGRSELNEMVLKVASGHGEEIEERVISNIDDWVWDIDLGSN